MESQSKWATAAPTLNLIFGMLALIFSSIFLGFLEESAVFILGLLQIGIWPAYLIGAMLMLRSGDLVGGNTFFYFATFFGIVPGLITIGTYFAEINGWPFDPRILGIIWLSVGMLLTLTIPAFAKAPALLFAVICAAGIAIDFMGLGYLNLIAVNLSNRIAGSLLFLVGIGAIYMAVAGILEGAGIKLPLGKSLLSNSEK